MTDLPEYDLILRNGTIYDGGGAPPIVGDLAITGQTIAAAGDLAGARGRQEMDVSGLAVAPGFINMLSWSTESLIVDGNSQSEIRQGVTLEVMGESDSWGPFNDEMKKEMAERQGDIKYPIEWTTLGEYLEYLEKRGVATNVTSFVGTTTLRVHELGYADRRATPAEMESMRALVRQAMQEGAMGISSALIYAPDCFWHTDELIELAKVAAKYDGMYISHLRGEGNAFLEGLEELITIAREANIRAEVYHLKAMGQMNWHKMDAAIARINAARAEGLAITADMYTYTAAGTGLDATMPRWVQEGGHRTWVERLKDPAVREKLRVEMTTPTNEWENVYLMTGSADKMIFTGLRNPRLKRYIGKTLAEVMAERGTSAPDTMMDLVIEDDSRVGFSYFVMSEDNLRKQVQQPWVAVDSDAPSMAPEGVFLKSGTHPRAYGTFARWLGKYVRDEGLISLEEGIRRLTSLPAENLKITGRGWLKPGYQADVAVFDYAKVQDHATFAEPHQYSTGMVHVFVNGAQVLKDGEHTGAKPGQFVRGPGVSERMKAEG